MFAVHAGAACVGEILSAMRGCGGGVGFFTTAAGEDQTRLAVDRRIDGNGARGVGDWWICLPQHTTAGRASVLTGVGADHSTGELRHRCTGKQYTNATRDI
jgi:hypothetical protein